MTDTTEFQRVGELIAKARFAFVTTIGEDGRLLSRPLAVLDREFDGDIYFFTMAPSPKTEQIAADSHVNVSLQSGDDYLSVAGTASVSRDQALIDQLWNKYAEAWFEQGRQDPGGGAARGARGDSGGVLDDGRPEADRPDQVRQGDHRRRPARRGHQQDRRALSDLPRRRA